MTTNFGIFGKSYGKEFWLISFLGDGLKILVLHCLIFRKKSYSMIRVRPYTPVFVHKGSKLITI